MAKKSKLAAAPAAFVRALLGEALSSGRGVEGRRFCDLDNENSLLSPPRERGRMSGGGGPFPGGVEGAEGTAKPDWLISLSVRWRFSLKFERKEAFRADRGR